MMVIRGIYERHGVTSLNHGIGFDTAAIELLLPTYGESLGLKRTHLPPLGAQSAPDADPGHRERLGGERALLRRRGRAWRTTSRARPDVFFVGADGSLRSNRVLCQLAGQYGVDLFIGSTLQMDADANSSTVTLGRLAGFGGAPNMGHDPKGRRHSTPGLAQPDHGAGADRARPQARGAAGGDLPARRGAGAGRVAGRGRGRPARRHADRARS